MGRYDYGYEPSEPLHIGNRDLSYFEDGSSTFKDPDDDYFYTQIYNEIVEATAKRKRLNKKLNNKGESK